MKKNIKLISASNTPPQLKYISHQPRNTNKLISRIANKSIIFFIFGVFGLLPASAAPIPWHPKELVYIAQGKNLDVVLKEILFAQGLKVQISTSVRGKVQGEFKAPPQEIFERLAMAYGFVWYYDGAQIYISPSSDMKSVAIPIAPLSSAQAMGLLKDLNLVEPRFPIRASKNNLLVTGPSRYINLVKQAINNEQGSVVDAAPVVTSSTAQHMQMRVFPLKYAHAQDVDYDVSDQVIKVPGMATLLRDLVAGHEGKISADKNPAPAPRKNYPGLRNNIAHDVDDDLLSEMPSELPKIDKQSTSNQYFPRPNIIADARSNAVLVHDVAERMQHYAQLITQLDKPQELVQIDVSVLEVSSAVARDLGMEWGFSSAHTEIQGNAIYSTASTRGLNLRLNSLEKEGDVRVLSRPKIMTLNNTEAVVGTQRSFYASVAGYRDVDLFPIRAGLSLRVTPLIIDDADARKVRLAINVGDGKLVRGIESVPETSQNFIATQVVLLDGQSLLIGGYQFDSNEENSTGIPYLRRLPWIGGLFRGKASRREQTERLFVITPRVITAQKLAGAPDEDPLETRHFGDVSETATEILRNARDETSTVDRAIDETEAGFLTDGGKVKNGNNVAKILDKKRPLAVPTLPVKSKEALPAATPDVYSGS